MKNAGIAIGLSMLDLGIAINGLNINGNQATATPAAYNAGPEEPTIVWYDSHSSTLPTNPWTANSNRVLLIRAWSDGTVEGKTLRYDTLAENGQDYCQGVREASTCDDTQGWFVISSPNEGLNAQADINFDEVVNGGDLGLLLASWGKAPRSSIPASNCPLGLMQ